MTVRPYRWRFCPSPQRNQLIYRVVMSSLLVLSVQHTPAFAQVTRIYDYTFKTHDLPSQVAEAMHEGKVNSDNDPIDMLMEQHKQDPDAVLVLLKPYLRDTNIDSRLTIIGGASHAPHTAQAIELLTALVSDPHIGNEAIATFYNKFTKSQIIKEGGRPLQLALYRAAVADRATDRGYLLLSCYKTPQPDAEDTRILTFLKRRRQSFEPPKAPPIQGVQPGIIFSNPEAGDRTEQIIALDLALIELGDGEALQRIQQVFVEKETLKLRYIMVFLKLVDNKEVLTQTLELLHNKNIAQEIRQGEDDKPRGFIRVCDVALSALQQRAGMKNMNWLRLDPPNYSDEELNENYALIKTALGL